MILLYGIWCTAWRGTIGGCFADSISFLVSLLNVLLKPRNNQVYQTIVCCLAVILMTTQKIYNGVSKIMFTFMPWLSVYNGIH